MVSIKQGQTKLSDSITASFYIKEDVLYIQPAIDISNVLSKCELDTTTCKKITINDFEVQSCKIVESRCRQ